MTDFLVPPSPGVLDISTYAPGAAAAPYVGRHARIASNEAALGPSPRAVQAAIDAASGMDRYPDPWNTKLRARLAEHYLSHPENILCSTGSEAVIHLIARCYCCNGDEVIIPQHAFAIYKIAALSCGARVVSTREHANFAVDVDAIVDAVTPQTRIVFLANPNNPTGAITPKADIDRLRRELPERILLVIDAAYREYVERKDYSSGAELVERKRGNVIVLGTFSKVYGLAGMRVGWALAPEEIVGVLNRARPAFGVPLVSQAAALGALSDKEHIQAELTHVRTMRPRLEAMLSGFGFRVAPGAANFTLAHVPKGMASGAALASALAHHGVLIRPLFNYDFATAARFTVGSNEDMNQLEAALAQVLDRSTTR